MQVNKALGYKTYVYDIFYLWQRRLVIELDIQRNNAINTRISCWPFCATDE